MWSNIHCIMSTRDSRQGINMLVLALEWFGVRCYKICISHRVPLDILPLMS